MKWLLISSMHMTMAQSPLMSLSDN
jgi:hypothetical protein